MHRKIVQIKVLVLQKHSVTARTCTHGLIQLTQINIMPHTKQLTTSEHGTYSQLKQRCITEPTLRLSHVAKMKLILRRSSYGIWRYHGRATGRLHKHYEPLKKTSYTEYYIIANLLVGIHPVIHYSPDSAISQQWATAQGLTNRRGLTKL